MFVAVAATGGWQVAAGWSGPWSRGGRPQLPAASSGLLRVHKQAPGELISQDEHSTGEEEEEEGWFT